MAQTLGYTDIDAILEKVIKKGVSTQLSQKVKAYKLFKGDDAGNPKVMTNIDMVNKTFNIPIQTGRHNGVLGYGSGAKLNHGKPILQQAQVSAKLIAASLEMDKFTLAVKNAGVAVEGVFAQYGKILSQDLMKGQNRMLWNNASGQVGTVNGTVSSSSTFVVAASTNGVLNRAKWIAVGDYVKIGSTTAKVSGVNLATRTVTVTGTTISATAGDAIYLADENGNVSDEITGIQASHSTADFQGITGSSSVGYVAQIDSSTTTITDAAIVNLVLQANEYGETNAGLCNRFVLQKIGAILTQMKRTADLKESPLLGGFKGLAYNAGDANEITIGLDYDAIDTWLAFFDTTQVMRGELQGLEWEDDGHGKMIRRPDYFERQAVLATMWNIGYLNRPAQSAFTAITG